MITLKMLDVVVDGSAETRIIALVNGEFVGTVAVEHHRQTKKFTAPQGEVSLHEQLRVAGIRQLFVSNVSRNLGIGSALLQCACDLAAGQRCASVNLLLKYENLHLLPFYEKRGFIPALEYPDGDLCLARSLDSEFANDPIIAKALKEFKAEINPPCEHVVTRHRGSYTAPCDKCGKPMVFSDFDSQWREQE